MKRCCLKSLHEETDRRDLSQKFKPVWIRRTSRMDQILVRTTRFCGKKMDNSHDGTCPHGLVAGTRVPTFMFLWQAAIFRQAFFQSSIFFMWLNQHRCLHVFDESRDISPPPCPGAFICIQNTTKCCSERKLWKWKRVSHLMILFRSLSGWVG